MLVEPKVEFVQYRGELVPFNVATLVRFDYNAGILVVSLGEGRLVNLPFRTGKMFTSKTSGTVPELTEVPMDWPIATGSNKLLVRVRRRNNKVKVVAYGDYVDYRLAEERIVTHEISIRTGILPFSHPIKDRVGAGYIEC